MYELYNFAQKTGKNYNTVVAPSVKWLKVSEHFSKLQNTSKGGGGGGGGGGGEGEGSPLDVQKGKLYHYFGKSLLTNQNLPSKY